MSILAALLVFSVIVLFHEFGHFVFAKKNDVEVTEFSLGMGPRIITGAKTPEGKKIIKFFCSPKAYEEEKEWEGVTKYSWKILPLGGSCAMVGEDERSESPRSLNNKSPWAKFQIVFGGPFFNFILAFVFSLIIIGNLGIDYPYIGEMDSSMPAAKAGIQEGDKLISVNGHKVYIGRDYSTILTAYPLTGDNAEVVVERDGKKMTFNVDPNYFVYRFGFTYASGDGADTKISEISDDSPFAKAGISPGGVIESVNGQSVSSGKELQEIMDEYSKEANEVEFEISQDGETKTYKVTPEKQEYKILGIVMNDRSHASFIDVIKYSFIEVGYWIKTVFMSLKMLITGQASMKQMSGPVGIVNMIGNSVSETASYGMQKSVGYAVKAVIMQMLYMSVLLSANLGVMNLLPIPALDGGRLVFIIIEAIRKKPIDPDKEGYVHLAGFMLLMIIMVVVLYNDIARLIK